MLLIRFKSLAIISSLVLVISACGSVSSTQPLANNAISIDEPLSLNSILPEIEKTQALTSPQRDRALLAIAERIKDLENTEADTQNQAISQLLGDINTDQLTTGEYARFTVLSSHTYFALENHAALYDLLYKPRLTDEWHTLDNEQQITLLEKRADVNAHFNKYNESISDRIALAKRLENITDITQNNEIIWQTLNSLTTQDIKSTLATSTDNILIGWYELAAINHSYNDKPNEKHTKVRAWAQLHPEHPAAINLPIDLQLLQLAHQDKPKHIALLLPLSGKFSAAANAIRDGFFSAYYSEDREPSRPRISLFDTTNADIGPLYDRAVAQGADLIIGPLEKDKVTTLSQHTLSTPTLALNYSDDAHLSNTSNINFYQFGLSLEDEAKQVAHHAISQGLKYALVIADNSDWSIRTAQSFIEEWQNKGGIIVDKREYAKDTNYSNEIKSLLNISESQERSTQLKRLFGQNFEFEPRRRDDIDMIFLVSRSREGRQIKPILAFHYAGNIPVYATSQLYSSAEDTIKTRDLNGIKVITLPWVINESAEKQAIQNNIRIAPNFERLYALGHDAYKLHNRLNLLSYSPTDASALSTTPSRTNIDTPSFNGATGLLSIDHNRHVKRHQPFIEIKKGKAEPLVDATPLNAE